MKSISRLLIILPLLTALSLQSCKSVRNAKGKKAEKAWKATLAAAEKETVKFDELQLSGRAQLNIPAMGLKNMGVSYRVSMEKDKRIWIKVNKLIEVARILARPDSLFVLDKINRKYIACDYSLAEALTGLKMDFEIMQDLVLGNFNPIPSELSPGLVSEGNQAFNGEEAGTNFIYTINSSTNKLTGIQAINERLNQNTKISYKDFNDMTSSTMPYNTLIEVLSPEALSIDLSHKKVELNPENISFSFKVPSNYEHSGCK